MTHILIRAAAASMVAAAASMPDLGQQTEIATKPGSGVVRKRDKPHGFWGDPRKHTPRELTPEQRAKHTAKMARRRARYSFGIVCNPCISDEQKLLSLTS